uniref:DRBM domain-containing protein n=1 Tax=Steinernema glaseri TaxID=37863 RepID=A0A1I8AFN1_9BILA
MNEEEDLDALMKQRERIMRELQNDGALLAESPASPPPPKRPRIEQCPFAFDSLEPPPPAPTVPAPESPPNASPKEVQKEVSPLSDDDSISSSESEGFVDELLEKKLIESLDENKTGDTETRSKRVLEHRGYDHFDVLPQGWVEVSHESGLIVYLERSSRVCTFGRPYFLGTGSVRHHKVPETAVTCLYQRKLRERIERREKEIEEFIRTHKDAESSAELIAKIQAPQVQTAEDFERSQLSPEELYEYAKGVFKFKTISVHRDKTWASHRNRLKAKKRADAELHADSQRPALPLDVQLITTPALDQGGRPQKKGFMLNPQGKTSVSVLHEYVQKVVKSTIRYHYEETRSSSNPFVAMAFLKLGQLASKVTAGVSIKEKILLLHEQQRREGTQHGSEAVDEVFLGQGAGISKKLAKLRAAIQAVSVLIPGIEFDADGTVVSTKKETNGDGNSIDDVVAIFNEYPIEHERIPELCARAGQPAPFLVLQECLKRYAASGNTDIQTSRSRIKHHKHEFVMKVGRHEVSVICANKMEGKQMASQKMIQILHPELKTWGDIIRNYGYEAQRQLKDARKKANEVTKLQGGNAGESKSTYNPNGAILQRLREAMRAAASAVDPTVPVRPPLTASRPPVTEESTVAAQEYSTRHPEPNTPYIDL